MRTTTLLSLFAFSAFIAATPARAVEETPNSIAGGALVNVDQAKALSDKGTLFVDTRVAAEYAEKHIKGAVNVPFKETFPKVAKTDAADTFDLSKLPADKAKAMVFYCNGSPCWKG